MYKAKLWDEDKWNIHSSSYNSNKYGNIFAEDKKDDKKYHEQKYGTKEKNASSDYVRKEEKNESDEEKSRNSLFEGFEDEKQKDQKELNEEEITFKAAKQIFSEKKYGTKKEKKKDINSIEDAIKKAIEEEKKVIVMDS